ncbi:NADH:flavin oxidoreductase/NADH oxidase [Desulfovibrio sp. X2]|uniref:oxidoreductase n=1 Tax=Desulfovibrio sp. X2 TaxID=941449 RepID=UPI000358AD56|nr:hypothetical protein [Desulfovibrio sp. X2]EPR42120.1 NADH:flavin oxidoreductase/NADH oxidase [Desulfovibrio sp. X2]
MSMLFTPIRLRGATARNRVLMAPMCMYSCENGLANDFHMAHYGARVLGGVGVMTVEATAVEPRGRISDQDMGLWNEAQAEALARIAAFARGQGALPSVQLAHAGRKAQDDPRPVAPSALAFSADYKTPAELSKDEIGAVVAAFASAAARAVEAGFGMIELHGAHGYLINEFLSPLTNRRQDAYGKDRALFARRVVAAVRAVIPDSMPLCLRVSATDWMEGGNEAEDTAELVNSVKDEGLDIVHVSTGGTVDVAPPDVFPGFQVPHAEILRKATGLPVVAGGLVEAPAMAEEIVASGRADMVFMARALLRDPFWVLHAAHDLGVDIDYWPSQYLRAKR